MDEKQTPAAEVRLIFGPSRNVRRLLKFTTVYVLATLLWAVPIICAPLRWGGGVVDGSSNLLLQIAILACGYLAGLFLMSGSEDDWLTESLCGFGLAEGFAFAPYVIGNYPWALALAVFAVLAVLGYVVIGVARSAPGADLMTLFRRAGFAFSLVGIIFLMAFAYGI